MADETAHNVKIEGGYLKLRRLGGGGDGGDGGNGGNGNGGGDVTGITPEIPGVLPDPPPGVFPAPTPAMPILGPLTGALEQTLPPGGVWPRPSDSSTPGHYVALCWLGKQFGWRYIIIAPDAIAMPQIPRPEPQPQTGQAGWR